MAVALHDMRLTEALMQPVRPIPTSLLRSPVRSLGLFVALGAIAACDEVALTTPDLEPLTLTVVGDVTIDSINPAYGLVGLVDPLGDVLITSPLQEGQYRMTRLLDAGVDVCDGYAVKAQITEDTGVRTQTLQLVAESGECVISSDVGIRHFVDLDFPFILGRPAGS